MQYTIVLFPILNAILNFPTAKSYPSTFDETAKIDDATDILRNKTETSKVKECDGEWFLNPDEFSIFSNGSILILANNVVIQPLRTEVINDKLCVVEREEYVTTEIITALSLNCPEKFAYEPHTFEKLPNGTVFLFKEFVFEKGEFVIEDGLLKICSPDYDYESGDLFFNSTTETTMLDKISLHAGRVGAGISIVALSLHLLVFVVVPARRNLPGYTLTSMSVAFLLAYCFVQIGQIHDVLGTSCIVSASMEHFFFLSAFFWMNVIAFDVWKSLRLATHNLVAPSRKMNMLRFLGYSIYAWGIPLSLAITAVAIDHSSKISNTYKPFFGDKNICWFTNVQSKIVFFITPSVILFVLNAIFFGLSAFMIIHNTMKDNQQKAARRNFLLYARIGLIMGVTWLMSIAGVIFEKQEIWLVFDILNSLQGLFIFLLFSCNQKTLNYFRKQSQFSSRRRSSTKSVSIKTISSTFKSESQSHHM